MNKNIIITIVVLVLIAYGVFSYVTKPSQAPNGDQNTQGYNSMDGTNKEAPGKKLTISQADSKAEFSLNEILSGKPTLVVGTTNQITGGMSLKADAPSMLTINEIKIDARTLKTDNEKRNTSLDHLILKSDLPENQFIVFKTTKVKGLPNKLEAGREFSYYIAGELTIKGVTKLAIFEAKGTMQADGSFKSDASTNVKYADYGITVPSFPFLAKVDKTTKLTISIVAK